MWRLLGIIIGLIATGLVLFFVVIPFTNSLTDMDSGITGTPADRMSNGSLVDEDEEAYYLDTNDIAIEPGALKVRDAKKILKIRYAKGEIGSLEYSERMSRL